MLEKQHVAAILTILSAGCALHRPANYRLSQQGKSAVLLPPGIASASVARRTTQVNLAPGSGVCPRGQPPVAVQKHKRGMRLTVWRDALSRQPSGWLRDWAVSIESQSCVTPGNGMKLAVAAAESMPLDPGAEFRLLNRALQRGEIDAGTRIQVVSPMGEGYETTWYAAQPRANGVGFRIVPLSTKPAAGYLSFAQDTAFYRLLYKSDPSEFTALLIAGSTPSELDRNTRTIETGPASCAKLSAGACVAIPKADAINLFVEVIVNGKPVDVPWGASLAVAIRTAGPGEPSPVLPKLEVLKTFQGRLVPVRFDRAGSAILQLSLLGGEVISWE